MLDLLDASSLLRLRMPDFQAAQVSRLAWALATSSVTDRDLLDALAARSAQLKLHPQQGLAMLAWSFAKLAGRMDLEHLARQAQRNLKSFKVNELSSS